MRLSHTSLSLLFVAMAALLASHATAQATYDDFKGTGIDKSKWFQFASTSKSTVANGFLRMFGRGHENDFGLLALDGLDRSKGNIDIVLKFERFRAGGRDGGFALFAFDAETMDPPERELSVGMYTFWDPTSRTWKAGFDGELSQTDKNNKETVVSRQVASTATAGEVRFQCISNTASLSYRAAGQSKWSTLVSWKDYFISNYISFGIEVEAGQSDGVDVFCDKITVNGAMVPKSVTTVGSRCHGLGTVPLGYPHINNPALRLLLIGGSAFRDDTHVFAIGVQKASLSWAGAPGCTLYLNPLLVIPGAAPLDVEGEALVRLPIPNDTTLRKLKVLAQFAATTNRNAAGLALSNGIELTIW